ncbi:hypothetical protein DFS34DRAFT_305160 [Phlyctochytrium arcticum]|nr:hypothetical protein DFS34DRAFT_305160 [Phlyctochytrium arcticum]
MAVSNNTAWSFGDQDPFSVAPSPATNGKTGADLKLSTDEETAYAYYLGLTDPQGTGKVLPSEAVGFLSKSQLPQTTLSEIWQLCDPEGRGYLTSATFYNALKYIALAQSGKPVKGASLTPGGPLPKFECVGNVPGLSQTSARASTPGVSSDSAFQSFGGTSSISGSQGFQSPLVPQRTGTSISSQPSPSHQTPLISQRTGTGTASQPVKSHFTGTDRVASHNTGSSVASHLTGNTNVYTITPEERERFTAAFESCKPVDGFATGDAARELFMKSTLPLELLSRIWRLVDVQGHGKLDATQFSIAMLLITRTRQGLLPALPATLPPNLLPQSNLSTDGFLGLSSPPASTRALNRNSTVSPAASSPRIDRRRTMLPGALKAETEWAIKDEEKAQSDQFFDGLDKEKKGHLTGQDSYEFFVKAKLPQTDLAKIWELSDMSKSGKLSKDEFAVAMHLIRARMSGGQLPLTLPPDLIPPSQRVKAAAGASTMPTMPTFLTGAHSGSVEDLMSGLGSPAASLSVPGTRAMSFSKGSSNYEALELEDRENELAQRKTELQQVEQQLSSLQPSAEEVRQRKGVVDAELKTITDKRNEIALEHSQLRAVFETESRIVMESETALNRERQILNIAFAELQQAQQTVAAVQTEKIELEQQLQRAQTEVEEMKIQIKGLNETALPMRSEIEKLRVEVKQQQQHRDVNEKLLASARADYEQLKSDLKQEQAKLELEKTRNSQVAQQVAVQAAINEKEKEKLKALAAERSKAAETARSLPSLDTSSDPYAAFSALGATANSPQPGLSTPTAISNLTSTPILSSTSNLAASSPKKAPPPPPPSKKPSRALLSTSQVDLLQQPATEGPSPVVLSDNKLPRKGSNTSIASRKSHVDDFEELFEANKPKKVHPGSAASPSPASIAALSPTPAIFGALSPAVSPAAGRPSSVKSFNGMKTALDAASDSGLAEHFGKKTASVKSLPLISKEPESSPSQDLPDSTSGPLTSKEPESSTSQHLPNPTNGFEPASQVLAAPNNVTSSPEPANPPAPAFPDNAFDAFSFQDGNSVAVAIPPAFDADFASAFSSNVAGLPEPLTQNIFGEPASKNAPLAPPVTEVDIEEEMKRAFASTPSTADLKKTTPSVSSFPTSDFDSAFTSMTTNDFSEDAFKFDASFNDVNRAGPNASFDADFASAFAPLDANPFGSNLSPQVAVSPNDLDAAFGGFQSVPPSDPHLPASGDTTAAFDDAFGGVDFASAFGPPQPSTSTETDRRPVPPPPAVPAGGEDAPEVKNIVALGFTKGKYSLCY